MYLLGATGRPLVNSRELTTRLALLPLRPSRALVAVGARSRRDHKAKSVPGRDRLRREMDLDL